MKISQNIEATILKHVQLPNINCFKNKIRSPCTNEELIIFLDETTNNIKETEIKILFLHYVKKLIAQLERSINDGHYRAFQFEYDQDRLNYNPEQWISAELEFLKALQEFNFLKNTSATFDVGQNVNAPMPLLRHEDMEKLFRWSRSTLNRRIALGLPFHEDPAGAKFFDVNEVNEWIKENINLMN